MKFVVILVLSSHIVESVSMKFVLILVLSSHIVESVPMRFVFDYKLSEQNLLQWIITYMSCKDNSFQ